MVQLKDDEYYNPMTKKAIKKLSRTGVALFQMVKDGKLRKEDIEKINCPPGYIFNEITRNCNKIKEGLISQYQSAGKKEQKPCKSGQIRNPKTLKCVNITGKIGQEILKNTKLPEIQQAESSILNGDRLCNQDEVFNPESLRCVKRSGAIGQSLLLKVKEGKLDRETVELGKCPQNYSFNKISRRCFKQGSVPKYLEEARTPTTAPPSPFLFNQSFTSPIRTPTYSLPSPLSKSPKLQIQIPKHVDSELSDVVECNPGTLFNPKSQRCVKENNLNMMQLRNEVAMNQRPLSDINPGKCNPGSFFNKKSQRCNKIKILGLPVYVSVDNKISPVEQNKILQNLSVNAEVQRNIINQGLSSNEVPKTIYPYRNVEVVIPSYIQELPLETKSVSRINASSPYTAKLMNNINNEMEKLSKKDLSNVSEDIQKHALLINKQVENIPISNGQESVKKLEELLNRTKIVNEQIDNAGAELLLQLENDENKEIEERYKKLKDKISPLISSSKSGEISPNDY